MIILRDSSPLPASCLNAVMALGNFDGLHLGHRAILQETLSVAKATGKPAGVMTFEPHPRRVFSPQLPPLRIFPFHEKIRTLEELGIAFVRVVRFTRAFAGMTAEAFASRILAGEMNVSHVVTGEDFTFGHNRQGSVPFLQEMGEKLGFGTTACPPVLQDGARCSSTRLRELLEKGDMQKAAALLSRPYHITGRVMQGDRRGRELGFPTANIIPSGIFLPVSGVYAVQAMIDGVLVSGVAHLGPRPVFDSMQIRLETHFFDYDGDLYGKKLSVELLYRIRGEMHIANAAELKEQIAKDCKAARGMSA